MSIADTKKQVEYYLSDKNLCQDEFFYKQIEESQDGFIDIDLIMKCNKIKQLKVTKQQIVDSLVDSEEVELNEAKDKFRRKANRALPEFTGQSRKKVKTNTGEPAEQQVGQPDQPQGDNPYDNFEPLIFTVKAPEGLQVIWSQITEALMKQQNISAPYVRYGKTEGNFALSKPRTPQDNIDRLVADGLKIGDQVVKITITEGDALKEFWAHHGKHFEGIIKRAKDTFGNNGASKGGKYQTKDLKKKQQQKEIVFHNQKYRDISQLKNIFKTILGRSENGTALKEPYHSMLVALLQYHDRKEAKLEGLKNFTVGQHPEHQDTRCFIAVKEDGRQEDFSCLKCIKNLEASLGL